MHRLLLSVALLLAGCGGGGAGSPIPATQVAAQSAPPQGHLVSLGDSITHGYDGSGVYLTDKGYPVIVASALGIRLTNLAVDGSFAAAVLANEVPLVPADASIVTVYAAIIDENLRTPLATYAATMTAVVAGIRARAPGARIVLIAPPDLSRRFPWASETDRPALVSGMKAALVATGLAVVDLCADPAMNDPANFGIAAGDTRTGSNEHPLASGHAAIATDLLRALQLT